MLKDVDVLQRLQVQHCSNLLPVLYTAIEDMAEGENESWQPGYGSLSAWSKIATVVSSSCHSLSIESCWIWAKLP